MPVKVTRRVNVKIPGLKNANQYLAEELRRAAFHIGDRLQESIRAKQRIDTGQERRRTVYDVKVKGKGNLNVSLRVYNTVIQALVDEFGAKPHFPPYKKGSKLYGWVIRKGLAARLTPSARAAVKRAVVKGAKEAGAFKNEARIIGKFAADRAAARADKKIEGVAFAIAKSISRRGLPRKGDPLRKPFDTTRKQSINMINTIFNFAVLKAVKRVNDEAAA